MSNPWDRQDHESEQAFAAFTVYRDLPPATRGRNQTWRVAKGLVEGRAPGTWKRWACDYQWRARAAAYDAHLDAVRLAAKEQGIVQAQEQHAREIELSGLSVLKETASLAHAAITDVVEWDADGAIRVKPSASLPPHVAAAIQKLSMTYDKQGRPQLSVEMHPKIRPLDLLGQHYSLWDSEKKQTEKAATNAFLEFLTLVKNGALDELEASGAEPPSLRNPPLGIVIEYESIP